MTNKEWNSHVHKEYCDATTHEDGTAFDVEERKELMKQIQEELAELEAELADDMKDGSAVSRVRRAIDMFTEGVSSRRPGS